MEFLISLFFCFDSGFPIETTEKWFQKMLDEKYFKFQTLKNNKDVILKRKGAWITPKNCSCWFVWGRGVCVRPSDETDLIHDIKDAMINSLVKHDSQHFGHLRKCPPNCCSVAFYPDENAACGPHSDDEELCDHESGIFSFSLGRSTFFDIISQQFWNAVRYNKIQYVCVYFEQICCIWLL